MPNVFEDNPQSIGRTPLVRLNRIPAGGRSRILAKIEGRNPAYSVKCRLGAALVWDAEKRGVLKSGMEIVEPTSGNTGIALASVAASKGYRLTLTMPENMSLERRKILRAFGANLVLTDAAKGMAGAVARAEEIHEADRGRTVLLQQFNNPANPEIHERTTGPEIWQDTDGNVDAVVAGVGTGGTITGISRFLKKRMARSVVSVAVEPQASPVITQHLAHQPIRSASHGIQGLGAGFIPGVLDVSMLDRVETVSNEEAFEYARRLAREEGILSGISSGAAVAVAVRLGREDAFAGKTIVVILPDSGERYLSAGLFDDIQA